MVYVCIVRKSSYNLLYILLFLSLIKLLKEEQLPNQKEVF